MNPVLELRGVGKTYFPSHRKPVRVLGSVSLKVHAGEFFAVTGPSGSGKTTLLNLMGLLDLPTCGEVLVNGSPVHHASRRARARLRGKTVGMVFQSISLLPRRTVLENILFGGRYTGRSRNDLLPRAKELAETFGLSELTDRPARLLSGGEAQRVAIARALLPGPSLLLADEPTGNLDAEAARRVMDALALAATSGVAVVLVTHNHDLLHHAHTHAECTGNRKLTPISPSPQPPITPTPHPPTSPSPPSPPCPAWFARDLWESLVRSPLRTGLTLFAMAVGALTLTLLMAVLSGLEGRANRMIADFGADVAVFTHSGDTAEGFDRALVDTLRSRFPESLFAGERSRTLSGLPQVHSLRLVQAEPAYPAILGLQLETGRLLDPIDIREAAPRGVAGQATGLRVGDTLFLHGQFLRVVGIAGTGPTLHVPDTLSGGWERTPVERDRFARILARHRGAGSVEDFAREVSDEITRSGHRPPPGIETPERLLAETRRLAATLRAVFGGVVALCLLLGGATLSSLMALGARQRLREIGLRTALGADRREIFLLFLAEGLVTAVLAGILGVICGVVLAGRIPVELDLPVQLTPAVALFPPVAALLSGLLFSLLPARAAATLPPAEALRGE